MLHQRISARVALAAAAAATGLVAAVSLTALGADRSVSIESFAFAPASVTVTVGDTVTWTNGDPTEHTVTADDASFDSGVVGSAGTFGHTFASPGTFAYHCSIHSSMTGTVVVAATPAATPSAKPRATVAPGAPTPPDTTSEVGTSAADPWLAALVLGAVAASFVVLLPGRRPRRARG